jgi:quinol monooxygenase YgiN
MLVIFVEFQMFPGRRVEFLDQVCENARQSLQLEEGCLRFDVCVDPGDENAIVLYEIYSDTESFQQHLASSHYRAFDAGTQSCVASKAVRNLELVSSPVGVA